MARIASVDRLKAALRERNFEEDEISQIIHDARSRTGTKQRRITVDLLTTSLMTGHGLSEEMIGKILAEACGYAKPGEGDELGIGIPY